MTAAQDADANTNKVICELKNMPYFVAQGYALGLAYASSLSGDTVSSILIGGMVTVMNGAFECRSGQMIQWYFDFETKALKIKEKIGQKIKKYMFSYDFPMVFHWKDAGPMAGLDLRPTARISAEVLSLDTS